NEIADREFGRRLGIHVLHPLIAMLSETESSTFIVPNGLSSAQIGRERPSR
ncbi:MAG: hypothetical protein JWP10_1926, partial [Nocardioidaceae bacterium]|nr:hypothetical protein [Nocardioidaceae bacterium]